MTKLEEKKLARRIKAWMFNNVQDNMQTHSPWEVNCTQLAENCAIFGFDKPEWLDDETHIVWDVAVNVAEVVEARDAVSDTDAETMRTLNGWRVKR